MTTVINNHQQSLWRTVKQRVFLSAPRLLIIGSIFSLLVGSLVLVVSTGSSNSNQDTRSQASNINQKATLSVETVGQLTAGQLAEFAIKLNLNDQTTLDGLQLEIVLPKAYFQQPQLVLSSDWPAKIAFFKTEENEENYVIKAIVIHNQPGQVFSTNSSSPLLRLFATAIQAGQAQIKFNPKTLATTQQTDSNQNVLSFPAAQTVTIQAAASGEQQALISFPFKLQGLAKAGEEITVSLWFQPTDELRSYTIDSLAAKSLETQATFSSDADGWLTPKNPIDITSLLQKNPSLERYQILVKTPVSLRQKVGQFDLAPGKRWNIVAVKNAYSNDWSSQPVLVGDFAQTGAANYNVLNILDITAIKNQYTDLEVPITANNKKFDLNYNNKIDILDPGLVLSNWTDLFVVGD